MPLNFDNLLVPSNIVTDLERVTRRVQKCVDYYQAQIKSLAEQNDKLKSEHYKDEELQKLQSTIDALKEENKYGFKITKEEREAVNQWIAEHNHKKHQNHHYGTIGGGFTYCFYPTSIGTIGKVKCEKCNDEFIFQEL
jgi:hypothetical protein